MRFRDETWRTMYAISTLKAPLTASISRLLGENNLRATAQKLNRLVDNGLAEKKPYGSQRVMYMLTLAGQGRLQQFLVNHPKPELVTQPVGNNANKPKRGYVPVEYPEHVAQPRTIAYPKESYVIPKQDYQRNDGNKHITSLGAFK